MQKRLLEHYGVRRGAGQNAAEPSKKGKLILATLSGAASTGPGAALARQGKSANKMLKQTLANI